MWSLGTSSFINFSKFWAQGHPPKYVWTWAQAHSEFRICIGTHHLHSMWDCMRSTSIFSSFAIICWMQLFEDVSWRRCQLGMPVGSASCWRCQLTIYMQSVIKKNVLVWAEDTVDEAQVHKQCHVFPAALSGHAFKAVHCFSQDSCKSRLHHFCKSRQEHTAEQNHFSVQAPRVILSS